MDQWHPQSQRLQVVRVVEVLNELLEIVKGGHAVLEVSLVVLNELHALFHEVGVRGARHARHQALQGFDIERGRGLVFGGGGGARGF